MRALVTGGAGFIGSHLTDALVARGDEVTVVDHLSRGHADNIADARARGAVVVRADVTDMAAMTAAFQRAPARGRLPPRGADRRAPLGRRPGRGRARQRRRHRGRADRGARGRRAAARAGLDRGRLRRPGADPDARGRPARAALAVRRGQGRGESYLQLFGRLHGLSTLALRMSNVYGPRQSPHGEAGVIAIFCGAAAAGADRDRVRRRPPVARLRLRRRRRRAFLAGGAADVEGALNVSTGQRDDAVRARRGARAAHAARPGAARRDPALVPDAGARRRAARLARADAAARRAGADPGRARASGPDHVTRAGPHRDRARVQRGAVTCPSVLERLFASPCPIEREWIFVDDASTDGSGAAARRAGRAARGAGDPAREQRRQGQGDPRGHRAPRRATSS